MVTSGSQVVFMFRQQADVGKACELPRLHNAGYDAEIVDYTAVSAVHSKREV